MLYFIVFELPGSFDARCFIDEEQWQRAALDALQEMEHEPIVMSIALAMIDPRSGDTVVQIIARDELASKAMLN